MQRKTAGRRPADSSHSLIPAFSLIVALLIALGAVSIVVVGFSPDAALSIGLPLAVAVIYLGAGLLAWARRPTNPVGALIVSGSAVVVLGSFGNSDEAVLRVVGTVFSPAIIAVCVHLVLIYPGGRLVGWVARTTVGFAYVAVVGMQAVIVAVSETAASNARTEQVLSLLDTAKGWALFTVQLIVMAVLVLRLVGAVAAARRMLASFYVYGLVAVVAVPTLPVLGLDEVALFIVQWLLLCSVPVAFVVSMLRGDFVPESTWPLHPVNTQGDGDLELSQGLVRVLGDPTASVLLWSESHGLRNLNGSAVPAIGVDASDVQAIQLRSNDERFAVHPIRDGDQLLGVIVYSKMLVTDTSLPAAAGRLIAVAVARQRLTDRLKLSEREVRDSRFRLVGAADDARAQIAQNLHDGIQMRLVVLSMQAGAFASRLSDSEDATVATALRQAIDLAAAEVRSLVHEVMPPLLVERGLGAAIEALADHAPIPATVEISSAAAQAEPQIPPNVQRALYFVAAEALTNVVKHAGASGVAVFIDFAGGELRMDISDDGVGGEWTNGGTASSGHPSGIGVRGIADRVETLGGRVTFSSVPGYGTRVNVSVPCEW